MGSAVRHTARFVFAGLGSVGFSCDMQEGTWLGWARLGRVRLRFAVLSFPGLGPAGLS